MAKSEETALTVPMRVGVLSGQTAMQEALPEFMRGDLHAGTEELGQFIVPPRLKTVQSGASDELKAEFNEGDLILSPQNLLVSPVRLNDNHKPAGVGEPFAFVPLSFFPEYLVENPIAYKGTEPFIRERSLDPSSDIARKCRDPQQWTVPHPERPIDGDGNPQVIRYVECMQFVILPIGIDSLSGVPIVVSFSKADHKVGSNLASLIRLRGGTPIYGCIFQLWSAAQKNAKGNWYGLAVSNPVMDDVGVGPVITDKDEYEFLRAKHDELKGRVQVNYEDEEAAGGGIDGSAMDGQVVDVELVPDGEVAF